MCYIRRFPRLKIGKDHGREKKGSPGTLKMKRCSQKKLIEVCGLLVDFARDYNNKLSYDMARRLFQN